MEKKRKPKAQNQKRITKKNGILLATAAVLLVVLVTLLVCALFPRQEQIVKIGDNSIGAEEMRIYLNSSRADVIMRYTAKGLANDENFWNTEVDGVTPMEEWLQISLDDCVYDNMIRIMAKEKELSESVSFDSLLADMKKENKRRAEAVANGEVIYGPQEYSIDTYLQITLANLYAAMQKEFIASYQPTDAQLQAYYEENKDVYTIFDIREIQQISITYGENSALDQAGAEKIASEIHAALTGGEQIGDVMVRYAQYAVMTDKEYDRGRNDRSDAMMIPQTYANAVALEEGACSAVTHENGAFYISRCAALFPGGYESFDNVKDSIAQKVSEIAFDEHLQERIDTASLEVDQERLLELAWDIAK